jgi:hypothetical protein
MGGEGQVDGPALFFWEELSAVSFQLSAKRRVRCFRLAVILSGFRGVGWTVPPGVARDVFLNMDKMQVFVHLIVVVFVGITPISLFVDP